MSDINADVGRLAGRLLQVVAVMLLAFAGSCACFMAASRPGDEFRDPNGWSEVLICLPLGLVLWFAGRWLIRRNTHAKPERVQGDD